MAARALCFLTTGESVQAGILYMKNCTSIRTSAPPFPSRTAMSPI